jgi:hypothetical protein
MHQITYQKLLAENSTQFVAYDEEILPFGASDLLLAKCSGTIPQIRKVIDNIQKNPNIKIIRVKNKLGTGNTDFLINFTFG